MFTHLIASTAFLGTFRAVIETLVETVDVGTLTSFKLANCLARRSEELIYLMRNFTGLFIKSTYGQ